MALRDRTAQRMSLERFTEMYPRLFRLAAAGAAGGIRRHGLLTASEAASRAGVPLSDKPRREALPVTLPDGTTVIITDNLPLHFQKLGPVLDDDLSPVHWMRMLNDRVFFWPDRKLGEGNLKARRKIGYASEWQVYDTRRLLEAIWDRTEIAPINTGSTIHTPARRGLSTFAAINDLDFDAWRRLRGRKSLDRVKEVTVHGSAPDAGNALIAVEAA